MKKYLVEITETLQKQIAISANSHEEAIQIMKDKYRNQEITLGEIDFIDSNFQIIKESKIHDHEER